MKTLIITSVALALVVVGVICKAILSAAKGMDGSFRWGGRDEQR